MEISKYHGANMIIKLTEGFTFEPLVEGLIETGSIGMIVGPAKSRKSMLALNLCFSLMSNQSFLGCKVEQKRRKILYINLELTREALGLRLRVMKQHYDVKSLDGFAFWNTSDFVGDDVLINTKTGEVNKLKFDQLIEALKKWGDCDLVVIDPLYYIVGEENDNVMVTAILKQLARVRSETGAAIAVVHHCKKDRVDWNDPFQVGRGASSIGGFFEWVIGIEPDRNNHVQATIHHGSRNLASRPDIQATFDDSNLVWLAGTEQTKTDIIDEIMGDDVSVPFADFINSARELGLSKAKAMKLIDDCETLERIKGRRGQKACVKRIFIK
jgi:archaellum biogenesis ATPase FlaH